jgi:hypothetical protein
MPGMNFILELSVREEGKGGERKGQGIHQEQVNTCDEPFMSG